MIAKILLLLVCFYGKTEIEGKLQLVSIDCILSWKIVPIIMILVLVKVLQYQISRNKSGQRELNVFTKKANCDKLVLSFKSFGPL